MCSKAAAVRLATYVSESGLLAVIKNPESCLWLLAPLSVAPSKIKRELGYYKEVVSDCAGFDVIECFTTTFLRAHSWLNWVRLCWNLFYVLNLRVGDCGINSLGRHLVRWIRYVREKPG